MLTARNILAEEAAEIGLVNRVVPGAALMDVARETAATIASHEPAVVAAAKRAINFGADNGMIEAMKNEERQSAELRAKVGR